MRRKTKKRENLIVKTGIFGILANILLSVLKVIFGIISNSIAIVLDAVNNVTDALSSIITVVGAKIAGKKPDKEHPFGHGRAEYLSALIIAIIIIYAGITSLIEAVKKVITPAQPSYSSIIFVVICLSIVAKIIIGIFFKKIGKKVDSDSLIGSANDALIDAIVSFLTLVSAVIFILTGLSLEAYFGIIISFFILRTGIVMFIKSISPILGERIDRDLAIAVKKTVSSEKGVLGACDLVLNNYGPDINIGSIHIEIPETMTATEIDKLTRVISNKVYNKHGVILTAVGVYSSNILDNDSHEVKKKILKVIRSHKGVLQMHGFYFNDIEKTISFDLILDYSIENRHKIFKSILRNVQALYPEFKINISMDIDAIE